MLTPDPQAPEMSQTTVSTNLLESLKIVTELRVDTVGQNLRVLAIDDVLLSVKEVGGDFVLSGVLHDGDNSLKLIGVEITSTVFVSRTIFEFKFISRSIFKSRRRSDRI